MFVFFLGIDTAGLEFRDEMSGAQILLTILPDRLTLGKIVLQVRKLYGLRQDSKQRGEQIPPTLNPRAASSRPPRRQRRVRNSPLEAGPASILCPSRPRHADKPQPFRFHP